MQRLAYPALVAILLVSGAAVAGPLNLNPQSASPGIGSIFAAPAPAEPAPVRQANLGGGFLEMLFRGGPGGGAPSEHDREPDSPAHSRAARVGDQDYEIDPRFLRQEVSYHGRERPGTIIINTRERMLYLVQGNGRALRYGIGVGRPGFTWAGSHTITNMREWPDWRPPAEMLRRQPNLPRFMRGGPDNPLGARAMYLGSTIYRIHGSNEPWTIGQAVSSGCIRMRNEDVIDLYQRVRVGTRVMVI
jgi:lipoprotein-anchoring transpeptidase ErfK/SrfK